MRRAWLLPLLFACRSEPAEPEAPRTTPGPLAVENLRHEIETLAAQGSLRKPALIELLLVEAQFLAAYSAYDRALELSETGAEDAESLLVRARVHAALHRFSEAVVDLDRAEALGAETDVERAAIRVATGRAEEAIPALEREARAERGFAPLSGLANAYAAAGRYADADRTYLEAWARLRTTSPFPYAWLDFTRGVMWSEHAGDRALGATLIARAVARLPEYAAANLHLARAEADRGQRSAAIVRAVAQARAAPEDPEPYELLAELDLQIGDRDARAAALDAARSRYQALLARHPLAFAERAAELFLVTGDPGRAFALAESNLANRRTEQARDLMIRAGLATGRIEEARARVQRR